MILDRIRRALRDRGGNVALTFALAAVPICFMVVMSFDVSQGVSTKSSLQDSTDAATLAVSAEVAKNPNQTVSQLKTLAQKILAADFKTGTVQVTDFHVCAPIQNDCTSQSGAMKMDTVALATSTNMPCSMTGFSSSVCSSPGATLPVTALTNAMIGLGATIQLNIAMDSSASMIVGSTPTDVTTISTWVKNHWNSVKPGDPAPNYPGGDNPPCAFACHDVGGATTNADIATGLTNAHSAGATTRFDVMIAAAQQLITHVQTEAANNNLIAKYTYVFNVMSFDTSLHQHGANNLGYAAAQTAVNSVTPGLDTYLSSALSQLTTQIGSNGTGASTSSPLKFLILVTDGLQSDRNNNWGCSSWALDSAWSNYNTCYGGYATTISASQCATIKNNGIVLAVLETPYVPLTGQSPNVAPYEKTVRHVIYPGGPNSGSTLSAALASCASTGYYFQATNPSDIATGFISLTDKFIQSQSRLAS